MTRNDKIWIVIIFCAFILFAILVVFCPLKTTEVPIEVEPQVLIVTRIERVEVPVEVIMEVPALLADWESPEELAAFLAEDDTDSHIYLRPDKDGVVRLQNRCEVKAIQLMNNAQAQGKRLSFVPLHRAEYFKWYGVWIGEGRYHAICGAIVGDNEFYYIEPSTDKIWLGVYLE